jgi:hypothetical protein
VDDHDLGVVVLAIQDHCAPGRVVDVVHAPGGPQRREEADEQDSSQQRAHGILSRRGFLVSNPRARERLRGV